MTRFFGLAERILSPKRVASSRHDIEDDPEKDIFKNLWKQRMLLPPLNSPYSQRRRWQHLLLIFVAYEQIVIPLQLSFQLPVPAAGESWQLPVGQFISQVCARARRPDPPSRRPAPAAAPRRDRALHAAPCCTLLTLSPRRRPSRARS